jgi:hypothetical protein
MSGNENPASGEHGKPVLPLEYQLLVQEEVRKIASRYAKGLTTVVGMFTVLGLAGIYGLLSQSVTSTLNVKLAAVDARIDQATTEERTRIWKSHDEVQATARDALRAADEFKSKSQKIAEGYVEESKAKLNDLARNAAEKINSLKNEKVADLGAKIKALEEAIDQVEKLRSALLNRITEGDKRLADANKKLEDFNQAVQQSVAEGADRIVTNPIFQDAVAGRLKGVLAETNARLDGLADGKSPLTGVWIFNGDPAQPAYSLEIAKNRYLLSGKDRLITFATFDPVQRTMTTDAISATGWPDNHVGDVGSDNKTIVWRGVDAKWTRP